MAFKEYKEIQTLKAEVRDNGLLNALFHHAKKAKQASDRMTINIQAEKTLVVIAEAQQMINAVDALYKLLNDDDNTLKED